VLTKPFKGDNCRATHPLSFCLVNQELFSLLKEERSMALHVLPSLRKLIRSDKKAAGQLE